MLQKRVRLSMPTSAVLALLVASTTIAAVACSSSPPPPARPAPTGATVTPSATGPQKLPDFKIVDYSREPVEPVRVTSGSTVRFHIHVKNVGDADYSYAIDVEGPGGSRGLSGLKVGETKEAILEWQPVCSSGSGETTYTITFTVDPDNVTPEKNETNNTYGPRTLYCV